VAPPAGNHTHLTVLQGRVISGDTGTTGGGRCGYTEVPKVLPMRCPVAARLNSPSWFDGRCVIASDARPGGAPSAVRGGAVGRSFCVRQS
jgi:hypothetical protein